MLCGHELKLGELHELKLGELPFAPDPFMHLETKRYTLALDGARGWRRLPHSQSNDRVCAYSVVTPKDICYSCAMELSGLEEAGL